MSAVKNQIYSKFSPTNIPGCQLWLDAADTITTGTGSTISTWSDKSQFGRDLTAYGGTTTNLTSGSFVQLGNSIMSSASSTIDLCNASFLIVCSANSTAIANASVFGAYGSTSTQLTYSNTCGFGFYMDGNSNKYRVYGQYGGPGTISNIDSAIQSPAIFFTSYSSSGTINSYLNGQAFFTAAGSARTTPAAGFTIGGEGYVGSLGVAGGNRARIYEIIVYNAVLSQTEQEQVQGYLAYKWGLQSLLPTVITATLQSANRIAWYDASNASSVTSSGGILSQWNDLSGNANHLTVARGTVNYTTDSTYTTNNVVNFTSTSSHLRSANYITYTADTTEVYVVARLVSMNSCNIDMLFCMADDTTNANSGDMSIRLISSIPFDGNTGDIGYGGRYYVNGANSIPSTTATYSNSYFLISCKFAWTGPTTSRIGISSPNSIGGAGAIVTARCWIGNVAEVVVYSSPLNSASRLSAQKYFATKWSLPITTPTYTYSLRPPLVKVFKPTDFSNCLVWLDAADNSKITGTSSVSAWSNKGTNGGSAGVGAGNVSTGFSSGSNVNGLNFLKIPFGSRMTFTTTLNAISRSWFWVARVTGSINAMSNVYFVQATQSSSDSAYFYYYNSSSNALQCGPNGIDVYIEARITSTLISNVTAVYSSINSTNTSSNVATYNGSNVALALSGSAAGYNSGNIAYTLGQGGVDFMEIIYYSRDLTFNERRAIEGYLGRKWGLTSAYPSDHPFKNIAPYTNV